MVRGGEYKGEGTRSGEKLSGGRGWWMGWEELRRVRMGVCCVEWMGG